MSVSHERAYLLMDTCRTAALILPTRKQGHEELGYGLRCGQIRCSKAWVLWWRRWGDTAVVQMEETIRFLSQRRETEVWVLNKNMRLNPGWEVLIRRTCVWVQVLGYRAGQSKSQWRRNHRKVVMTLPALHAAEEHCFQGDLTLSTLYWWTRRSTTPPPLFLSGIHHHHDSTVYSRHLFTIYYFLLNILIILNH